MVNEIGYAIFRHHQLQSYPVKNIKLFNLIEWMDSHNTFFLLISSLKFIIFFKMQVEYLTSAKNLCFGMLEMLYGYSYC